MVSEKDSKKEELENLKKEYLKLKKKFNLPGFDEMNQDFHIEKLSETESIYLIREVRRFMVEKLSHYMRFVEATLNPSNATLFVFSVVKTLNSEDKKSLSEVYKELMKIELKVVELDLIFDENEEANFVVEVFKTWQKIKKDLSGVLKKVNDNWDKEVELNNKGYFG